MTKSAPIDLVHLAILSLLLLFLPHQATSSTTRQQTKSHSRRVPKAESPYLHSNKPVTSIHPVKYLNFHAHQGFADSSGGDRSSSSSSGAYNDFDRLNRNERFGGPITRGNLHDAMVQTTRQRPSFDIVVMGVTSWN